MKPSEPSPLYGLLLPFADKDAYGTRSGSNFSPTFSVAKSAPHLLCNNPLMTTKDNTLRTQCLFPRHTRVITQCFLFQLCHIGLGTDARGAAVTT